ncbi:phage tail protein, partial [Enterobacter kobei]|nr:phage tail protein [Enterobacter kobei]
FADVMNGTSDVTITINGVAVTVPGQRSLAKKGANSDITSLSGLTTALSVAQGGTGAKNAADARTNFGLGTAALKNNVNGTLGDVLLQGYGNLV